MPSVKKFTFLCIQFMTVLLLSDQHRCQCCQLCWKYCSAWGSCVWGCWVSWALQAAASVQGKTHFCAGVFSGRKIQSVKLLLEHKLGLAFTNVGSVSCYTDIFSSIMRAGYKNQSKNGYIQKLLEVMLCLKWILCNWNSGPGMSETRILNRFVSVKMLLGGASQR